MFIQLTFNPDPVIKVAIPIKTIALVCIAIRHNPTNCKNRLTKNKPLKLKYLPPTVPPKSEIGN